MEHRLYIPAGFADRTQRILIIGHSHHRQEHEEDHVDFTIDTVERAKAGEMQVFPFFARQPRYLGLNRRQYRQYYETVALMNFIPVALLHRYATPPQELLERGRQRFIHVLSREKPTHVFVLSSRLKFGQVLPQTSEEARGENLSVLTTSYFSFPVESYRTNDHASVCCQLPHPQAAKTAAMQEAFDLILAM